MSQHRFTPWILGACALFLAVLALPFGGARAENEDPAGRFALAPMLDQLTPAVVQAAARTYLDPARYVRVTLLPEGRTP
jgi:hypothetical protein